MCNDRGVGGILPGATEYKILKFVAMAVMKGLRKFLSVTHFLSVNIDVNQVRWRCGISNILNSI